VDGTAEEHLRIGALKDAGDAGVPLQLGLTLGAGAVSRLCAQLVWCDLYDMRDIPKQ